MSRAQWDELVAHAREETPNECCGYLRCSEGSVEEVFRANNAYQSPRYGYDFDFDALRAVNDLDDEGFQVAIYHSHPRSPAEPSQTDINVAQYPHWTYVIVSLDGEPQVRAWRIADGRAEEEELVVEQG
jgi:proteasome lid subunit RPN8/RPN11